jgi:aldose 1-epimerase
MKDNSKMATQIVEISDRDTGAAARISVGQGFNCFSWKPVLEEGPREMLWADPAFDSGEKRPSGSGIPLLFPFPGRIGGAAYSFEGRDFTLEPGDAYGNAIHGFVFNRPWRTVERSAARLVGEFQASIDDTATLEHWPADFRIRVSYEVRGCQLVSDIEYQNTGAGRLPCGFATHAYFRLPLAAGSDAADTIVSAPVHKFWELDRMIPTGKLLPAPADWQLAANLRLGDHKFDTVFADLSAGPDGLIRTRLTDRPTGRTLMQTFDTSFTQCVVYTPPHREAICLEPYTCVPDAIRLAAEGHETGLQILAPNESRRTTIALSVTG